MKQSFYAVFFVLFAVACGETIRDEAVHAERGNDVDVDPCYTTDIFISSCPMEELSIQCVNKGDAFLYPTCAMVGDECQPCTFIAHTAIPMIEWNPVDESLHDGVNIIARLTVRNLSAVNPLIIQQMLFRIEQSGGLVIEEPSDGFVWLNGSRVEHAPLFGGTTGGFFFSDGVDHLLMKEEPWKVDVRVTVSNVTSGSWIRMALFPTGPEHDGDPYRDYIGYVKLIIQSPGLLEGLSDESGWFDSGLFWSDLALEGHVPFGLVTTMDSSQDFLSAYMVPGADGSSTITAL